MKLYKYWSVVDIYKYAIGFSYNIMLYGNVLNRKKIIKKCFKIGHKINKIDGRTTNYIIVYHATSTRELSNVSKFEDRTTYQIHIANCLGMRCMSFCIGRQIDVSASLRSIGCRVKNMSGGSAQAFHLH